MTSTAATTPVVNGVWIMTTSEIPPTAAFGVDLLGVADPGLLDLTALGMPGCQLRTTLDQIQGPWFASGSTHNLSLFIPNHPSLLNAHLFAQSAVFQLPAVNAFGAITSNGIDGRIGNL